jgi:hypothetical protein
MIIVTMSSHPIKLGGNSRAELSLVLRSSAVEFVFLHSSLLCQQIPVDAAASKWVGWW